MALMSPHASCWSPNISDPKAVALSTVAASCQQVAVFSSLSVHGEVWAPVVMPSLVWIRMDTCWFSGFDIEGLPSAVWPGGETEALTRIERHLERKVGTAPKIQQRHNQSAS